MPVDVGHRCCFKLPPAMDLAHATVAGPSEIASPTQMGIDLNKAAELAKPPVIQIAEVDSI